MSVQDKIGPVCRSAMDCAVIYDVLRGRDPGDPASTDVLQRDPFALNLTGLRVGLLADSSPEATQAPPSSTISPPPLHAFSLLPDLVRESPLTKKTETRCKHAASSFSFLSSPSTSLPPFPSSVQHTSLPSHPIPHPSFPPLPPSSLPPCLPPSLSLHILHIYISHRLTMMRSRVLAPKKK